MNYYHNMDKTFLTDKGKTGLANLGATCYLNTAIQCLGYCHDFLKFVISAKYKKEAEQNGKIINEQSVMNELRDLYIDLWINNNSLIPRKFINAVKTNIDFLEIHQQNDINEFLVIFISKLNSDICYNVKLTKKDLIEKNNYSTEILYDIQRFKMDISWLNGVGKEYSELVDLLYGQSIMQIVCGNCNKITHNYEIYTSMMVPITERTNTLKDCIQEYMGEELMNNNEDANSTKWKCDECKCMCKSKKTTKLWRNPRILIISLKRFTKNLQKNEKQIEIPDTLDISDYTLTNQRCNYTLSSIAFHHGSFHGGHYTAICKHPDGNWYDIDDLSVSKFGNSDNSSVFKYIQRGYVYFYTLS